MAQEPSNGCLIVFDGIDGVGKSTQLELAKKALQDEGRPVQTKRNLGGTPIGEKLRDVMLSKLPRPSETNLYLSVAIQEALVQDVADLRAQGSLILMDRGPLSLAAYEVYGSGLAADLAWPHVDAGMRKLRPELTIIYTADLITALSRISRQDYFESQTPGYFEKVASGYAAAAKRYQNIIEIDANRPAELVHADTMAAIRPLLAKVS